MRNCSLQPFPDVTICSFNPFKLSEVNKNADFAEIKKMLDEYAAAEEGTAGSDTYGFQVIQPHCSYPSVFKCFTVPFRTKRSRKRLEAWPVCFST